MTKRRRSDDVIIVCTIGSPIADFGRAKVGDAILDPDDPSSFSVDIQIPQNQEILSVVLKGKGTIHDQLKDRVNTALLDLYSDRSVSIPETLDSLIDIRCEVEEMIAAVKEDLGHAKEDES